MKEVLKEVFFYSIGLSVFLLFWEFGTANVVVPKPSDIVSAVLFLLNYPDTWQNIVKSTIRVYLSVFIALILGAIIGSLGYFNEKVSRVVDSFTYPTQFISAAVWSLIAIVVFGLSPVVIYFVVIIVILPNIFVAVQVGLEELDRQLIEFSEIYTDNKLKIFRYAVLPQVVPHILIGMIRAHAIAWKIVILAEIFVAVDGLGYMVHNYYRLLDLPKFFAVVLIIVILGLVTDRMLRYFKVKVNRIYQYEGD